MHAQPAPKASDASSARATQPFFSAQPSSGSAFFAPMLQAKCATCEDEDKLQRVAENQEEPAELQRTAADEDGSALVQRKCDACEAETRILPQLQVGRVDDPLETEADEMADRVVRRQTASVNDEERQTPPVQAKVEDSASSESSTAGLEGALADSHGSGTPLAPHIRDEMEDSFGADFSAVRLHTGAASAEMNEQIGARAFTYGTDIHFNEGEFSPGTQQGTHLLAHELTHVVQQNSGVRRAPKRVQTKLLTFGPTSGMPRGNAIHDHKLLPEFKAVGLNEGLWIEPPVPGANRKVAGPGLVGKPDFYRDKAPDSRTIGINEDLTGGLSRLRGSSANAAPQVPLTPGGEVQEMKHAPKNIELGDVKPGQSGEEHIGQDQIATYSQGIRNTAKAVNDYQLANNHPARWNPDPSPMADLDVPPKIAKSSSSGHLYGPLSVWEWRGHWKRRAATAMKGSIVVYKSSLNGVWAYEWMPDAVPQNVGDDPKLKRLLERLDTDVKPRLEGNRKPKPKLRAPGTTGKRTQRAALRGLIRRKPKPHEKFDEQGWLGAYNPWRTEADKTFADPKSKDNVEVLEALTDGKKRTRFDPGVPQAVKERATGAATIRHWVRYGKLYGWFRKTFDRVYVKLAAFAQKVRAKVKKLSGSGGAAGFGNWIKAAALALFKVAKKIGAWAVSMVVDKLLDSLQEGVINVVKQLAEAATPDEVKSKIQEVEDLKAHYEQMLAETQEKLEQRLFGDKLEMFSKLDEYMKIASTISTIVSIVRWGIRIVACASPPLLGCLWNLAIAALEFAFAKIMETCWFQTKVFGWVNETGIDAIVGFPGRLAQTIANEGNALLKLPDGIGPLFATITVDEKFNYTCEEPEGGGSGGGGGGGPEPTEEQKALMDLAQEFSGSKEDEAKFEAFIEMAAKRAADYSVALDAERIRKLGPLIRSLTVDQMKQLAANQPTEGVPVPVEEFLKSIATLTQAESERKAARNINYEKAQRSNPKFEQKQMQWKPELFVESGIASDSKAFADAIYDIQTMLGLKADGMAGPATTKAFYERNNLPKDSAYQNAVALVEAEKQAREAAKGAAERRKKIDAMLNEPDIKAAMATPFPSEAQLKTDLTSFPWDDLDDGGSTFVKRGGRPLFVIKTSNGHRLGAYVRIVERQEQGVTTTLMLDTSRVYALDTVPQNETIAFAGIGEGGGPAFLIMALPAQNADSFSGPILTFFGTAISFD